MRHNFDVRILVRIIFGVHFLVPLDMRLNELLVLEGRPIFVDKLGVF